MKGGRPRTVLGTYGAIHVVCHDGRYTASTRYRDLDGRLRRVRATATAKSQAAALLKQRLLDRPGFGGAGPLDRSSPFSALAEAWLADLELRELAPNTKDNYREDLARYVQPVFQHYTLGEITTGRVEWFLKREAAVSYSRAKHSRTMLNLLFGFALRQDAVPRNPLEGCSPLKKPKGTQRRRRRDRRRRRHALRGQLTALEDAGLSFIVGSPVSNAPSDLADQLKNRGNFFADRQTIEATRRMGTGKAARDRRVVWQYSAARERRDNRTLNLQIERAQEVADGKRPIKKNRFVQFTGDKPGINQDRIDQARIVIGLKGYVTNIPAGKLDGPAVVAAYHDLFQVEKSFRMAKTDLRARPIFHHEKDSIEAHLTIVFAALAIARDLQDRTGVSIRRVVHELKPPPRRDDQRLRPRPHRRHSARPRSRRDPR